MTQKTDVLIPLRNEIDQIDDQLLELLQRRAGLAIEIGQLKKKNSINVIDRSREKNLLGRLMSKTQNAPLSGDAVREIFGEIIKACRAAQAPTRVSFLGPFGTFSHAAALYQFGTLGIYNPSDDLPKVFQAVEEHHSDFALVPFENSIEGIVGQTLDLLSQTNLKARGTATIHVSLALMSKSGDLAAIRKVASHPQALAQARGWLSLNLPGVELVATASTAAAVSLTNDDPGVAVIGHPILADFYNLNILVESIEDKLDNQTNFLVMGHEHSLPTGRDCTLVCFATAHKSGSLYASLQPLADAGVNLTRLHSRPSQVRPWEYNFFLELDGHFEDEHVKKALKSLESSTEHCRLLGSYEALPAVKALGPKLIEGKNNAGQ